MHALAVVAWLTAHGCPLPGAVGITANLWAESRLDPAARGSGLGLGQLVGPRRTRMLVVLGSRWREMEAQLGYIMAEALSRLDRRGVSDWDATCASPDYGTAVVTWLVRYERGRGLARRLRAARWISEMAR